MRALVSSPIFLRIDKRGEMSGVILRGVVAFAAILCNSLSDLPLSFESEGFCSQVNAWLSSSLCFKREG